MKLCMIYIYIYIIYIMPIEYEDCKELSNIEIKIDKGI